mgnify:CR=1 FL=1
MKLKQLYVASLIATLPATSVFAAALERSGQSIQAFLEPGNYIEAGFNVTDHHTSAKLTNDQLAFVGRNTSTGRASLAGTNEGDITPTYLTPNLSVKAQINDKFSIGLIYDEPFGLDTEFSMTSRYFSSNGNIDTNNSNLTPETQGNDATSVKLDTKNITLPIGFHPNNNSTFIFAPVFQHLNGSLNIYGTHYQSNNSPSFIYHQSKFKSDDAYGWLLAYQYKSDSEDFKTSITYRSKIKHNFNTTNNLVTALSNHADDENTVSTPQSVNLNFSKKLATNTIANAEVRWVNWKNFEMSIDSYRVFNNSSKLPVTGSVNPPLTITNGTIQAIGHPGGYNPISYNKDQWSINLGLQQKLTDKWQIEGALGWDSGVGKYLSHYTPTSESWSAGIGLKYSPASNYFVQTGLSYTWYEDIKGQHAKQQAINSSQNDVNFNDSYALTYDFKIGYRF